MDALNETIKNISVYIILTTLINNLLTDSTYRKYIRFFTGMVLIAIIINPLVEFVTSRDSLFDEMKLNEMIIKSDELNDELKLYEDDVRGIIEEKYNDITEDIIESIVQKEGLIMSECILKLDEDGVITHIYIRAYMSETMDIGGVVMDADGRIRNNSLSIRSDNIKEAIAKSLAVDEDIIDADIYP